MNLKVLEDRWIEEATPGALHIRFGTSKNFHWSSNEMLRVVSDELLYVQRLLYPISG